MSDYKKNFNKNSNFKKKKPFHQKKTNEDRDYFNKIFDKNLVVELGDTKRKERIANRIKDKVNERADEFRPFQKDSSGNYKNSDYLNEFGDEISDMNRDRKDKTLISEALDRLQLVTDQNSVSSLVEELKNLLDNY